MRSVIGALTPNQPDTPLLDVTPQERLALIVLAVLITAGGLARHAWFRAEAAERLEFSAEAADTLNPGSGSALQRRVEQEVASARVRGAPLAPGERIDPNSASAEELDRLPRIGPALADRIVEHRRAGATFLTPEDLRSVPGIGPAVLEGIAPHLQMPPASAGGARTPRSAAAGVDLNRATVEQLQTLPGIGPVIAERIVAHREANGPFRSFEDLEDVSGIGARLRERLQTTTRLGT